jgi:hypothetical protein
LIKGHSIKVGGNQLYRTDQCKSRSKRKEGKRRETYTSKIRIFPNQPFIDPGIEQFICLNIAPNRFIDLIEGRFFKIKEGSEEGVDHEPTGEMVEMDCDLDRTILGAVSSECGCREERRGS